MCWGWMHEQMDKRRLKSYYAQLSSSRKAAPARTSLGCVKCGVSRPADAMPPNLTIHGNRCLENLRTSPEITLIIQSRVKPNRAKHEVQERPDLLTVGVQSIQFTVVTCCSSTTNVQSVCTGRRLTAVLYLNKDWTLASEASARCRLWLGVFCRKVG